MKIKLYNCQTNEELQEFDLASAIRTTGKCIVGRSATSGLILESSDVSRNHGEFSYKGGQYYFADIGSSNGSLFNNEIATKNQTYLLKAGDVIQLGDFLLVPQPTTGVFEEATVIAPIASQFPSVQESSFSEVSADAEPVAIATTPEFVANSELPAESQVAMAAADERDESKSEASISPATEDSEFVANSELPAESQVAMAAADEWDENISAVVTEASFEESMPPEADEQYILEEFSAATTAELTMPEESHFDGVLSHEAVEQIETAIAQEANLPQETMQPEAVEENITQKLDDDGTSQEEPSAEISAVVVEEANISEESMPPETFAEGITEEFPEPIVSEISTSTEREVEAAPVDEETYVQTNLHELTAIETTDEIVSPTNEPEIELTEATDEELGDRDDGLAIPEVLKEKYIALLAHESQKAELVDFIERHQTVFSKCQLMATSPITEALMHQSDITVSRKLANLTAGGYQEVNLAIASKELLAVIFLRDFFVPQTTQANDEALTRACNVNQVIFAGNVATAQALEGYLQHLIASTPKVYHS